MNIWNHQFLSWYFGKSRMSYIHSDLIRPLTIYYNINRNTYVVLMQIFLTDQWQEGTICRWNHPRSDSSQWRLRICSKKLRWNWPNCSQALHRRRMDMQEYCKIWYENQMEEHKIVIKLYWKTFWFFFDERFFDQHFWAFFRLLS